MQLVLLILMLVVGTAVGALAALRLGHRSAPPAPPSTSTQDIVELVLSLTGDKLADHAVAADRQLDQRNAVIEQQVAGMAGELSRVAELVTSLQRDRVQQHAELTTRLSETARQSRDLVETTQSLRQALASPKARGQWGERMADDVLRSAGLVEGVNYLRQKGLAGGGIPDVTFLLPGERVLHMDVKFPIDNYVRALEATSPLESEAATAAFLRDVRQRVKEITTRAYIDPDTTVDEVLLFIPNESVYSFIHEHDPAMVDTALAQRVVLCSPFTLFAVLAVIRQTIEQHQLERTGDEILQCLSGFRAQWTKYTEQVDLVARRFESTQKAFGDLAGARRKALQRTVDHVDGLRIRRGLPGVDPAGAPDELPHPPRLQPVREA